MNKKLIILSVLSLLIITSVGYVLASKETFLDMHNDNELTLIDAYQLGLKKAIEWNPKAALYQMTSVDDQKESSKGLDGKRKIWNLEFAVPKTEDHLIVSIVDKKVVDSEITKGSTNDAYLIYPQEIMKDSPEILKKAQNLYNLQPGKGWAVGYHFTLRKNNDTPIITVVGLDQTGYFTRIFFNSVTGDLISAGHKVPLGGGLFKITNTNPVPLFSNTPIAITGVATIPNSDSSIIAAWGVQNPYTSNEFQFIKISKDDGEYWNELKINNRKENILRFWFSENYRKDNKIYLATRKNISISTDNGENWREIFSTKSDILDVDFSNKKLALLTSVGLEYSDNDGVSWDRLKIPQETWSVQIDSKGSLYVGTRNGIFKRSSSTWIKLDVPLKENLLGFNIKGKNLLTYTSTNIGILDQESQKWSIVSFPQIRKVFLTTGSILNNRLYVLAEKRLFKLIKGGDNNEWKTLEIDMPQEGEVMALVSGQNQTLFLAMTPNIKWENLERER